MAVGARLTTSAPIVLPPWVPTLVVASLLAAALAAVGWSVAETWQSRHQPARPRHHGRRFDLHAVTQPYAEGVKVVLQMFIGGGLAAVILLKLLSHVGVGFALPFLVEQVYARPTLEIVGLALAYSSALELAYALFTRGPDEAVEPLIMGLAAAILVVVSGIKTIDLIRSTGVTLLVVALAGLFVIRQFFIVHGGRWWDRTPGEQSQAPGPEPQRNVRVVEGATAPLPDDPRDHRHSDQDHDHAAHRRAPLSAQLGEAPADLQGRHAERGGDHRYGRD